MDTPQASIMFSIFKSFFCPQPQTHRRIISISFFKHPQYTSFSFREIPPSTCTISRFISPSRLQGALTQFLKSGHQVDSTTWALAFQASLSCALVIHVVHRYVSSASLAIQWFTIKLPPKDKWNFEQLLSTLHSGAISTGQRHLQGCLLLLGPELRDDLFLALFFSWLPSISFFNT